MSWFADLAGKAENLLNNLDEQTAVALQSHNVKKTKHDKNSHLNHASNSNQKPRRPLRMQKRPTAIPEVKSIHSPARNKSPTNYSHAYVKDVMERPGLKGKNSPTRIKSQKYTLEHCPKTLVNDVHGDFETESQKKRRYSLPSDLIKFDSDITIRSHNLKIENVMLKNEVSNMETEVRQIVIKLQKADDDLREKQHKLDQCELRNHNLTLDNETLSSQLKLLKEKIQEIAKLEQHQHDDKRKMAMENTTLKDNNRYLEERVKAMTKNVEEASLTQQRLETELRHAQTFISELQSNLAKSNEECQRLEKEWETYKLRVKSMLHSKDNELKAMQDGLNVTEDKKVLMEQLNNLKEERDELSEAITNLRNEFDSMKQSISIVENRNKAAERVVTALRDALKEERSARNRAENQLLSVTKELKGMQNESGQTIASLRTALLDKEAELAHLRETASSIKTIDTSALNVADYDVSRDAIDNEKIHYLTETLVQRQEKVDKLLAENNMLKIQMDKLQSKFKTELANRAANHSIVNVQSVDHRTKRGQSDSFITSISNRIAAVLRRNPMLRIFVIIYMISLHFWVLTVLLTSTPPENFIPRKN